MSEYDESSNSYSSTSISIKEKLPLNYINEKLLKKICFLLEALIDLNPVKKLRKDKTKFDLKNIDFKDDNGEIDPIQMNTTDSTFLLDNDDAIIFDIHRKNNKK